MGLGLEVFDENGAPIFIMSDRLTRIVGIVTGSRSGPVSGSITIPHEIIGNGTIFVQHALKRDYVHESSYGPAKRYYQYVMNTATSCRSPEITISGNVITYRNVVNVLMYGVY